MPSAIARPSAATVRPASGAGTDTSGKNRAGTHTAPHPRSASIQPRAAHARRGPVAVNNGTAAATRSPHMAQPAPWDPEWNRRMLSRSRFGVRNAKPSDAGSKSLPRVGERPREQQHDAEQRAHDREAERTERELDAAGDRDREHERERGEHEQPQPDGEPRTEQCGEHREAQEPPASPRRVRVVEPGVAPAARDPHRGVEQERQEREEHERAEATFRDRVARRGVDAVRETGRERRAPEADDAVPEPVRPERTQRDRQHHHQGAAERDRAEEHGAEATHQRQRRRRGGRRAEARVAPRGAEGVEQVADTRPDPERADRRDAVRDQAPGPEQHERRGTP